MYNRIDQIKFRWLCIYILLYIPQDIIYYLLSSIYKLLFLFARIIYFQYFYYLINYHYGT